jgi:hypothetical protein
MNELYPDSSLPPQDTCPLSTSKCRFCGENTSTKERLAKIYTLNGGTNTPLCLAVALPRLLSLQSLGNRFLEWAAFMPDVGFQALILLALTQRQ